jgi:tetratricopeptide (TPR) repeat protein
MRPEMKGLAIVFFVFFILHVTGCATTSYRESSEGIEQLVKEKRYGQALDRLSDVAPSDPDFSRAAARYKEVEVSASRYEQGIRSKAQTLIDQGSWEQALDLYDEALSCLPRSVSLKTGLAELQDRQRKRSRQLELDNLLLRGDWLIKSLPIYREIALVNPRDRYAQSTYQGLQEEAGKVAEELESYGTGALETGDDKAARRFLTLALELHPTASLGEKLMRLEDRKKETKRKERLLKQRKQEKEAQRGQKIAQQVARYEKQVGAKEYLAAKSTLKTLEKLGLDRTKVAHRREQLEQLITRETDRLFSRAVTEYTRGEYENAARLWRRVVELDPDHAQARESLERALRVLRKIEELRKKEKESMPISLLQKVPEFIH